jgi:molecular chaperone GrpE (heat shock protein)
MTEKEHEGAAGKMVDQLVEVVDHVLTARHMVLEAIEKAEAGTGNTGTLNMVGEELDSALASLGIWPEHEQVI